MYKFIENYAKEHKMPQTLAALPYAREKHSGQFRKGGTRVPYIRHPLTVARHARSLGLCADELIAAALLHDVCEDCGAAPEELPVSGKVQRIVALLTRKGSLDEYYSAIAEDAAAGNYEAVMIKLLDRCNNVSGIAEGFTRGKMLEYVRETEERIYPLIKIAEENLPQFAPQIFAVKYHIKSVIDTIKHLT